MTEPLKINRRGLVLSLSRALDLLTTRISKHHPRVTLMALRLGQVVGLSEKDRTKLFYTAILHDLGVVSTRDKLQIMNFDYTDGKSHTDKGNRLLKESSVFSEIADLVHFHHDRWLGPNNSGLTKDAIPVISQIVYLVDRIEVLISDDRYILQQKEQILKRINDFSGTWFNSDLVDVFTQIARPEAFWLDLDTDFLAGLLAEQAPADQRDLTTEEVGKVAQIFTRVIDAKSRFTKSHCQGVSELSIEIAREMGWAGEELEQFRIAAFLHDLGKLSVPDEILDKPAALTPDEYSVIKRHPYYAFYILKSINGFEDIYKWASFHHERLDSKGYPFGLQKDNLPLASRIIAVADIFTALNEDRPYRRKLPKEQVLRLLEQQAKQGAIDGEVLKALKKIKSAGS